MLARTAKSLLSRVYEPWRYWWGLCCTKVGGFFGSKRLPIRMLVVSDGLVSTSEQQLAPLKRYAVLLRRQFGLVTRFMSVDDAKSLKSKALTAFSIVCLKLSFRIPAREAEQIVADFRQRLPHGKVALVYFDGDDDLCIQWPGVLTMVDLYVKKHVFADPTAYLKAYVGKSNLTDYVANQYGTSFASNMIPSSGGLRSEDLPKIHLGWNIALDNKISTLFQHIAPTKTTPKTVDIICRATVPPDNWMFPLRDTVLKVLGSSHGRFKALLPNQRVSQDQYYEEMRISRICVSPFGYGEICWRDFEAILCGCLLIKPDMSHVRTIPNIFVAGETYVPVRWDYADLIEKCEYYLANEEERARICDRAYQQLAEYYNNYQFVRTFGELLKSLGIQLPSTMAKSEGDLLSSSLRN